MLEVVLMCRWSVRHFWPESTTSPVGFLGTYPAVALVVLSMLTLRVRERLWGQVVYDIGYQGYVRYLRQEP